MKAWCLYPYYSPTLITYLSKVRSEQGHERLRAKMSKEKKDTGFPQLSEEEIKHILAPIEKLAMEISDASKKQFLINSALEEVEDGYIPRGIEILMNLQSLYPSDKKIARALNKAYTKYLKSDDYLPDKYQ